MLSNFKAVGPTEAELYLLKVEQLDVCIRSLFANSVTHTYIYIYIYIYIQQPKFF